MNSNAVRLNELAQGLRELARGLEWFENLSEREQSAALRDLSDFCYQAHPTRAEAEEAIRRSGLRPTHTPAVLILHGPVDDQVGKIAGLTPRHERIKAFRLLIQVLAVADARRRERFCADGCGHDWHHLGGPA